MVDVVTTPRKTTRGGGGGGGPTTSSNDADMQAQAIRLFPFLEPTANVSRKKLSSVEAQRIISVLDATINRVKIASLISPLAADMGQFSKVLTKQVEQDLREHKRLEEKMAALDDQVAAERPVSSAERTEVTQALQHSTRVIARHLQNDPGLLAEAQSRLESANAPSPHSVFIDALKELRMLMFEKLLTSVEEEKQRRDYLASIISKEMRSSQEVQKLQSHLAEARRDRNTEVSKRNDVIRRLKEDLHEIKTQTSDCNKRTEADAMGRIEEETEAFKAQEALVCEEIEKLKELLKTETEEHRESELALRKRKFKIETEVENWITKYDAEMGDKQEELEDLMAVYDLEKEQLRELEEAYAKLKVQYDSILAEQELAREKRKKAEQEMAILISAATLIQAIWRGCRARRALRNKNKKKKGGRK